MAGGQVVNDLISTLLKQKFKFARPLEGQIFKKEGRLVYGMPSSHSQFIMFFSTYMILKMVYQWPYRIDRKYKSGAVISLAICVGLVTYSRLFFSYHTIDQVAVGCFLGSFISCSYFSAISILRDYGILDWLLKWKICKVFQIKDSFHTKQFRTLREEREAWEEKLTGVHYRQGSEETANES